MGIVKSFMQKHMLPCYALFWRSKLETSEHSCLTRQQTGWWLQLSVSQQGFYKYDQVVINVLVWTPDVLQSKFVRSLEKYMNATRRTLRKIFSRCSNNRTLLLLRRQVHGVQNCFSPITKVVTTYKTVGH